MRQSGTLRAVSRISHWNRLLPASPLNASASMCFGSNFRSPELGNRSRPTEFYVLYCLKNAVTGVCFQPETEGIYKWLVVRVAPSFRLFSSL